MTDRRPKGNGRPVRERLFGRRGEVMPNGGRFVSLYVRFTSMLLITAAAVIAAYAVLAPLAVQVLRAVHMSPSRVEARLDRNMRRFAAYVEREDVRSVDASAVSAWTKRHRTVFLTVSADNGGPEGSREDGDAVPAGTDRLSRPVRFADRTCTVTIADNFLPIMMNRVLIAVAVLALTVLLTVILFYYHRQIRAIVTLSGEVEAVSTGDLKAEIRADRSDEIGRLAMDVSLMRDTVLEKMAQKDRAWQANADLLTSVSHDIRTPLTTLLGYMELLSADSENMTPEQRAYLRVCTAKTAQIKGLSDKLFLYFWAFHSSETGVETEAYEAAILFEQLIGEYLPTLSAEGFTAEVSLGDLAPEDRVRVSLDCLRRVTDNVFDNVRKYADPSAPVLVTVEREGERLAVTVRNAVGRTPDARNSSTRIGIRTCVTMMELMKGTFETREEDRRFLARFSLPVEAGDGSARQP